MSLKLVFTQKPNGLFNNHDNIEIPQKDFFVKHDYQGTKESYQQWLKVDKECSERVAKFKTEQKEFEKRRLSTVNFKQVKIAQELGELAFTQILQLQLI